MLKSKLNLLSIFMVLILIISCGDEKPQKLKIDRGPKKEKSKDAKMDDSAEESEEEQTVTLSPEKIAKAKEIIAAASDKDIAAVDGKAKYKMFCAACHGFTGNANINGAKDLTKSKVGLVESVAQVYHGQGLMTPFKGIMKDEEIVAVCNYILEEITK